jgi:hypothetical protein
MQTRDDGGAFVKIYGRTPFSVTGTKPLPVALVVMISGFNGLGAAQVNGQKQSRQ